MPKKKDKQPKVIEKKLGRHKVQGYPVMGFAYFDENLIEIDPRQSSFDYFETLIHEKLHLQFPKFSEEKILKLGHDMATFLWDHCYRKVSLK